MESQQQKPLTANPKLEALKQVLYDFEIGAVAELESFLRIQRAEFLAHIRNVSKEFLKLGEGLIREEEERGTAP